MSSRILSHRSYQTVITYRLTCEHVDATTRKVKERGWGFSFDCDANGKVNVDAMPECARANYLGCVDGSIPVSPLVLERNEREVMTPPVMRCECGHKLTLWDSWATSCDCGREYNGSGQLLAPRSQWGEETGEQGTF